MSNDVSREFLSDMEHIKVQLSNGLDNLNYLIEAVEDFINFPQKESYAGALWCAYDHICGSYKTMNERIESEYDYLRGKRHD